MRLQIWPNLLRRWRAWNAGLYCCQFDVLVVVWVDQQDSQNSWKQFVFPNYHLKLLLSSLGQEWYRDFAVQSVEMPESVCLFMLQMLVNSTWKLPRSFQRQNNFYVSLPSLLSYSLLFKLTHYCMTSSAICICIICNIYCNIYCNVPP